MRILLVIIFVFINSRLIAQDNKNFNNVNLQLIEEVNLTEFDIFEATGLSLDTLGNIVFFDWNRQFIGRTSIGNISDINLFAGKKGKGPGEFQNVLTTEIDQNEIYVAAIENRKISKWSLDGEMIKEYPIRTKNVFPTRMTVCNEAPFLYILSRQYWRDGILHVYNKEVGHIKSFAKVSGRDEQHVFYNEGYLTCDDSGNLYHSLMYVNKIRKYSPSGELILEREVYGIEENKEILEVDGRWTSLHKEAKTIGGDIHTLDEKLYVAFSGIRPRRFTTIDVYSTDKIEYQYSIEMPNQFLNFAINQDNIVTIDRQRRDDDVWLRVYSYRTNE